MRWGPDAQGHVGMFLSKDLVGHAAQGLRACLTRAAPRLMTWQQLGEAAWVEGVQRRLLGRRGEVKPYQPDWMKCADHFAIHAGRCGAGGWVGL